MRTLVATDFDGTIAGIRTDPASVEIDATALEFLRELQDDPDFPIALISGRSLDDLTRRSSEIRCWRAGSHGLEIANPSQTVLREPLRALPELDSRLESDLLTEGLRIEKKRFGVALHWRDVAIDVEGPAIRSFADWATGNGLKLTHGRKVLEASISGGGKREALQFIETQTRSDRLIYAGDDLTDFEALEYVAESGGVAILAVTPEREERPAGVFQAVTSISELVAVIRKELKKSI